MAKDRPVAKYSVRWLRWFLATAFGLFFLLLLLVALDSDASGPLRVVTVLLSALALLLMVRGGRAATVLVFDDRVVIRSLTGTRTWRWRDVRRFVARDDVVGVAGYRRRVLFLEAREGDPRKLAEINARPRRNGQPTWVDELTIALNRRLS